MVSKNILNDSKKENISLVLLGILLIMYQIYALMWDRITYKDGSTNVINSDGFLLLSFAVFLMGALIFGITAYRYQEWATTDAAEIAVFAWAVISIFQVSVFGEEHAVARR